MAATRIVCDSCGYDLRGNASGTCPECGAKAARAGRMPPQWWLLGLLIGIPTGVITVWALWLVLKGLNV